MAKRENSQKDTDKKKKAKASSKKATNKKATTKKTSKKVKDTKKIEKNNKKLDKVVKKEPKKEVKEEIVNNFEDKSDELYFDFINNKEEEPKKKQFSIGLLDMLIVMVLTAIVTTVIVGATLNYRYKKIGCGYNTTYSSDKNLNEFINVYSEVVDNYYEEVDRDAMIDAAISGMLDFLEDKYSIYLDASSTGNLSDTLSGTYDGVGIAIYGASITEVYKNSPAEEAGIKSGDVISSINGVAIDNENAAEISKIIGDSEEIALVVKRGNEELSYDLKVSKIVMPVVTSNYFKYNNKGIGYINISSLSSTSVEQFSENLIDLENKGIDSLIIDLRNNGGGYLTSAVGISSVLMEKNSIVYIIEKKSNREEIKDMSEDKRDYKIVVLVNKETASASEILALALRDNKGAIIVGSKTYGKGSVQTTKTLSDGTMMKYTSAKWYGPKGESIDGEGITPDYEVKAQADKDAYLEKALDLLK